MQRSYVKKKLHNLMWSQHFVVIERKSTTCYVTETGFVYPTNHIHLVLSRAGVASLPKRKHGYNRHVLAKLSLPHTCTRRYLAHGTAAGSNKGSASLFLVFLQLSFLHPIISLTLLTPFHHLPVRPVWTRAKEKHSVWAVSQGRLLLSSLFRETNEVEKLL